MVPQHEIEIESRHALLKSESWEPDALEICAIIHSLLFSRTLTLNTLSKLKGCLVCSSYHDAATEYKAAAVNSRYITSSSFSQVEPTRQSVLLVLLVCTNSQISSRLKSGFLHGFPANFFCAAYTKGSSRQNCVEVRIVYISQCFVCLMTNH